jgi:hypothetical protein
MLLPYLIVYLHLPSSGKPAPAFLLAMPFKNIPSSIIVNIINPVQMTTSPLVYTSPTTQDPAQLPRSSQLSPPSYARSVRQQRKTRANTVIKRAAVPSWRRESVTVRSRFGGLLVLGREAVHVVVV